MAKTIHILIIHKNCGRSQNIEVAKFAFGTKKRAKEYKKELIADYKNIGWKATFEIVKIEAYI